MPKYFCGWPGRARASCRLSSSKRSLDRQDGPRRPTPRPGRRRVVRVPALIPGRSQQPRAFYAACLHFAWPRRESRLLRRVTAKQLPLIEAFGPALVWRPPPERAQHSTGLTTHGRLGSRFYLTTHPADNVEGLPTAPDTGGFPEERRRDLRR
jgi:hypothetical protein